MTIDDLLHPILKNTAPLRLDDSPQTIPAWDSLAQIHIIAAIEEASGEELSTDEVLSLTSVGKVIEVCHSRGLEVLAE